MTAVEASLYRAPIGLPVTPKIEPWTNCGWYPSVSFSASSFQFARVRCLSQPAADVEPLGVEHLDPALVTLVHLGVVGQ